MSVQEELHDFLKSFGEEGKEMPACISVQDSHIVLKDQNIVVENNDTFIGLPKNLEVQFHYGDLAGISITGCHNFPILESLCVSSNGVRIENCNNFEKIGSSVQIEGELELVDLPKLHSISVDVTCGGVFVENAPMLREIPDFSGVRGTIHLKNCASLEKFSETFSEIHGSLDLVDCEVLQTLPQKLLIHGNFYLQNCPRIVALPRTFIVEGTLNLDSDNSIVALPESLKVISNASFRGCTFHSLPEKIAIGGHVYLHGQADPKVIQKMYEWQDQGMIKGEIILS